MTPARRPLTDQDRARIAELREAGLSLSAIATEVGRPRSTIQYVVEGLRLTPAGVAAVRAAQEASAAESEVRAARARRAPRAWSPDEDHREALRQAARKTLLLWRADELVLREGTERVLEVRLIKAWLETPAGDVVVRAAVEGEVLVEWARSAAAVYHLPARMAALPEEKRRVVWIPVLMTRTLTARRLRDRHVEVRVLEELRG